MPKMTASIRRYRADLASQAQAAASGDMQTVSREIMLRCDASRVNKQLLAYICSMWTDYMPVGEIALSLARRGVFAIHKMSLTTIDIYALLYELHKANKVKDRVLLGLDYSDQDLTLEEFRKVILMWQMGASAGLINRSLSPQIRGKKSKGRKPIPSMIAALYRRAKHIAMLRDPANNSSGLNCFFDPTSPGTTDNPNVNYYFANPKQVYYFRPPSKIPDPFADIDDPGQIEAANNGDFDEFNEVINIAPEIEVPQEEFAKHVLDTVNPAKQAQHTPTSEQVDADLIAMIEAADADLAATGVMYDKLEELAAEVDAQAEQDEAARAFAVRLSRRKEAAKAINVPPKPKPTHAPRPTNDTALPAFSPEDFDDLADLPKIRTATPTPADRALPHATATPITDDDKDAAIRDLFRRPRRPQV